MKNTFLFFILCQVSSAIAMEKTVQADLGKQSNQPQDIFKTPLPVTQNVVANAEQMDREGNKHYLYKRYKEALKYLEPLAEFEKYKPEERLSCISACLKLGIIFFYGGGGVERDYAKSHKYMSIVDIHPPHLILEKCVQKNYLACIYKIARCFLAHIYYHGCAGVPPDFARIEFYLNSIHRVTDQYLKASLALLGGKIFLEGGHGVVQDFCKAKTYLTSAQNLSRQAYEHIHQEAELLLAQIPPLNAILRVDYYGEKGEASYEKAVEILNDEKLSDAEKCKKSLPLLWATVGKKQDRVLQAQAFLLLGDLYYQGGYGIIKNSKLALDLFSHAQEYTPYSAKALVRKGKLYWYGNSLQQAQACFIKASQNDEDKQAKLEALLNLGEMFYYYGKLLIRDNDLGRAFKNFTLARNSLESVVTMNQDIRATNQARWLLDEILPFLAHCTTLCLPAQPS